MCGICGIYGLCDKSAIRRMNAALKHRGPDDEGYFFDNTISLAMRRLSIIDLKHGKQPLFNEDRTLTIIYNGEIYNYKKLRRMLENKHEFRTDSDTEVILHAFEEWGTKCLKKFEGMFAFAIYDLSKKELFLARDRFGIKPLFYAKIKNRFVFASEIKSLYQFDEIPRAIDKDSLTEKFLFGHCIGNSTLFLGIKSLLPGHHMIVNASGVQIQRYYSQTETKTKTKEPNILSKLSDLMEQSIKRCLTADVPVGIFLSGGLDSSIITAIASKISDKPLLTFTIDNFSEDTKYAEVISKHFGTDHHSFEFDTDGLINYIYSIEDTEPNGTGPLLLSRKSKRFTKSVLSGQASDELFGGYQRYKEIKHHKEIMLQKWQTTTFASGSPRTKMLFNYFNNYIHAIEKDRFDGMLRFDMGSKLTNNQLAPVDRTSMAAGIEARIPYLDSELTSFIQSIPYQLKYNKGVEKYILRKLAKKQGVPDAILKRKKFTAMESRIKKDLVLGRALPKSYNQLLTGEQQRNLKIIEYIFIENQARIPKKFSLNDLQ